MPQASRFDAPPLQQELSQHDIRWRRWFQDMWTMLQAQALPLPTLVTIGASPAVYHYVQGGNASVILQGGTVSLVEWSRDNTVFYTVGTSTGLMFPVSNGDYLRITYSALPTVVLVLR